MDTVTVDILRVDVVRYIADWDDSIARLKAELEHAEAMRAKWQQFLKERVDTDTDEILKGADWHHGRYLR